MSTIIVGDTPRNTCTAPECKRAPQQGSDLCRTHKAEEGK